MDLISAQRGKFGAYQNRLEHIYDNVGSYSSLVSLGLVLIIKNTVGKDATF